MGQERKKMRKVLSRFDIVFFTIAAFISLDTIALTAAYGGGETFFWLIFTLLDLAAALRHDRRRARLDVPGRGRPLRVAAHGLRPPRRLTDLGLLLDEQPGVDGRLARRRHRRDHQHVLPQGPDGHRGLDRRRHPRGVGDRRALAHRAEVGQVDGHHRHHRALPRARHLPRPGRRLPGDQGQAGGHRDHLVDEADHHRLPRRHRPAAVPLRRLRALHRRRRGDEERAARRAQDDHPLRDHRGAGHRLDDPRRAARHARRRTEQRRRLRRRLPQGREHPPRRRQHRR